MAAKCRIHETQPVAAKRGFALVELPFHGRRAVRRRNPGAPGFTLIELLVVIAIIALLVSILLPSIQRAKRMAEMVKCMGNLHGIGQAAHVYAAENDGWVPRNDYDWIDKYLFWAIRFAPYLGADEFTDEEVDSHDFVEQWVTTHEFFDCPGLKNTAPGIDYTVNNFNWEAYKLNVEQGRLLGYEKLYKHPRASHHPIATRVSRLKVAPGELLYICEASNRQAIKVADMHHDSHCAFNRYGQPAGGRMIKPNDMRHNGKTTFVCFDGHAETREMTPENLPMRLYVPNHE